MHKICEREYASFKAVVLDATGIDLKGDKRELVVGRLASRLRVLGIDSFSDYLNRLSSEDEKQIAIDLITTNETYFFRERAHFDRLQRLAHARPLASVFRVWSAASSTGEEAYTAAMVLADCIGASGWEVVGTDISRRVVEKAATGQYPASRAVRVPDSYRRRFCLRGTDAAEGMLMIDRWIRDRVSFRICNLNASIPDIGRFDVVLLRNVLIYFSAETRKSIVRKIIGRVKPGGVLMIGHTESIADMDHGLELVAPSVYRCPGQP